MARSSARVLASNRTIGIGQIARLDDAEIHDLLCRLRWPPNGEPICPRCGGCESGQRYARQLFRCRACRHEFSVTSGTSLQSGRLPLSVVLEAAFLFATARKGVSSTQMSDWVRIGQKSIWLLLQRFREALNWHQSTLRLSGVIEMDVQYFGGTRRRANCGRRAIPEYENDRTDTKIAMTLRQRGGPVIAVPVRGETRREILRVVRQHVVTQSTLISDEARGYGVLELYFELWQINHATRYADGDVFTNGAESFHARAKRGQRGVYHRYAHGAEFDLYLAEYAFRHSYSHLDTRSIWEMLLTLVIQHPVSPRFAGYWQRSPA